MQRAYDQYACDLINDEKSAFIRVEDVSKPDLKNACRKAFAVNRRDFLYVTKEREVS